MFTENQSLLVGEKKVLWINKKEKNEEITVKGVIHALIILLPWFFVLHILLLKFNGFTMVPNNQMDPINDLYIKNQNALLQSSSFGNNENSETIGEKRSDITYNFNIPKEKFRKGVVYINLNTDFHFEITFSFIALSCGKGPEIPHTPPIGIQASKVLYREDYIKNDPERLKILQMQNTTECPIFLVPDEPEHDIMWIVTSYDKMGSGPRFKEQMKLHYLLDTVFIDYKDDPNVYLICHTHSEPFDEWKNVYHLSPHGQKHIVPTYFPFKKAATDYGRKDGPLYIIQGGGDDLSRRRNWRSLIPILKNDDLKFQIKWIAKKIPKKMEKYRHKLIPMIGLADIEYHQQFGEAYAILPLVDETNYDFYSNQLSSSFSYGIGFGLDFVSYASFADLYSLDEFEGKVYRYSHSGKSFENAFKQSYDAWWAKRKELGLGD